MIIKPKKTGKAGMAPEYDSKGLVPAIAQDYKTGEILMVAYMNKKAFGLTLKTGKAWFFSRSRKKLWLKGETSGNILRVKNVFFDCDRDCILLKVELNGVACHTGNRSCFFTKVK